MKKLLTIFFLALLIVGCSNEVNSKETTKIFSELEQSIVHSVMENFGYRQEFTEDAVKLVEFDEKTEKLKIIAYIYSFDDETYDEFKADILDSCATILQDVKRQHEVQEVVLIVETTLEDREGQPIDMAIFNMVFERKNLQKINFHELDPLHLSKKANFYIAPPVTM
ncbi:putative periplasmic lipoprotein [Paenisporosarcina antarctica]|uniref:Lipoprotein n=1 Tax=Paenisporosarcina antarctica TaxID=417367 RepID=A0A4P6ZZV1_9BACL|nr:hypothetical protein [Paenisporosarcina antarctica]QBP42270.1 hypothetical protein E2636_14410 [Paenisporosarcina antarctica]